MNTDKVNADFMDLADIALRYVPDERTRYQIIMLMRKFKEDLEEQEVKKYGTSCS